MECEFVKEGGTILRKVFFKGGGVFKLGRSEAHFLILIIFFFQIIVKLSCIMAPQPLSPRGQDRICSITPSNRF